MFGWYSKLKTSWQRFTRPGLVGWRPWALPTRLNYVIRFCLHHKWRIDRALSVYSGLTPLDTRPVIWNDFFFFYCMCVCMTTHNKTRFCFLLTASMWSFIVVTFSRHVALVNKLLISVGVRPILDSWHRYWGGIKIWNRPQSQSTSPIIPCWT